MGGARILEETAVTGIMQERGRVTGVVTDRGEIEAEYVVNCGGMWARELGKMAGVNVPLHAAEHYYLITEPMEGMRRDMPIVEDPDLFAYYRDEMGGLMLGLFEPVAKPWGGQAWGLGGIPETFSFGEIPPDWERMMPHLELAMERIPARKRRGCPQVLLRPRELYARHGPPDGRSARVKELLRRCGFQLAGHSFWRRGRAGHGPMDR